MRNTVHIAVGLAVYLLSAAMPVSAQTLEHELQRVGSPELASLARQHGDAARGAIVFFQPHMACAKCHSVGERAASPLGPDLASLGPEVTDLAIVDSVLYPSKTIREGFQQVIAATRDGRSTAGLIIERSAESLVLRDIARGGATTVLRAADIEELRPSPLSIMPAGLMNQLTSRQQFYDLIRYLIEIRDGGAARARALQPPPTLLVHSPPEYEQRVDHAGLIRDWNEQSIQRGKAIYERACANCHGTKDAPGSLPTSLRFADGTFKNGSDPFAMYRTLTWGFGQMAAQTWMVPVQKYDVIHYIRETYLRAGNPSQWVELTDDYLARLPAGDTRGPEPSRFEAWSAMDYGPMLSHTFEVPGGSRNLAYKGLAVRLDSGPGGVARGRHWTLFDADTLRVAAGWSARPKADNDQPPPSNFIDWEGIQFNGKHGVHPRVAGDVAFANAIGPGWADPTSGSFEDDRRVQGRDGRRYGPLPRDWGRLRGVFYHSQHVVLSYAIGNTEVLESPRLTVPDSDETVPVYWRVLNVGPRDRPLALRVADYPSGASVDVANSKTAAVATIRGSDSATILVAGVVPPQTDARWSADAGRLVLKLPAGDEPIQFAVAISTHPASDALSSLFDIAPLPSHELDLSRLTHGGPARWPERLHTRLTRGADDGPFAVDTLEAPVSNPWGAQTRFTGLDFFSDGRLAVCSWDGDVWIVELLEGDALRWQRIASGLFQPLGLKIVDGKVHVLCRDQLAVLHDRNSDGEIDYYECLNNDHQVTEHFHEFAMGLQTDAEGNFYYAKSARHALPAVVPHHGTLLRVSHDGTKTDILATGFRAANGVCLNRDGSFFVTDQEGHWMPKNRINWVRPDVSGKPKFFGNMFGYTDVTDTSDSAMEQPLCWITNEFDRSPAELLWVDSPGWGPLDGSLLNLSYGYGKVFVVPHETVGGRMQGGMLQLPIPALPTGVMRGRFGPDGQLYACGMFAWAGSATQPGGLFRIRATGRPMHLVTGLRAKRRGLRLTFTEPLMLDRLDPSDVEVRTWLLRRSANYGSKHHDLKSLEVESASLSADGRTLHIDVPDIQPTMCMEISYRLNTRAGPIVSGVIHNTIHNLAAD